MIALRRTLSLRWLGLQRNTRFLWWLKRHFGAVSVACQLSSAQRSRWWPWGLPVFFPSDALRVAIPLPLWVALELTAAMVADFCTMVAVLRGTVLLFVMLLVIIVCAFLERIDADASRLHGSPRLRVLGGARMPLLEVFLNALSTLVLFVARTLVNRHYLLAPLSAGSKLVRCQLYRSPLVLRPAVHPSTSAVDIVRVLLLLLGPMVGALYALVALLPTHTGLHDRELLRLRVGPSGPVLRTRHVFIDRVCIVVFWLLRLGCTLAKDAQTRCRRLPRRLARVHRAERPPDVGERHTREQERRRPALVTLGRLKQRGDCSDESANAGRSGAVALADELLGR